MIVAQSLPDDMKGLLVVGLRRRKVPHPTKQNAHGVQTERHVGVLITEFLTRYLQRPFRHIQSWSIFALMVKRNRGPNPSNHLISRISHGISLRPEPA